LALNQSEKMIILSNKHIQRYRLTREVKDTHKNLIDKILPIYIEWTEQLQLKRKERCSHNQKDKLLPCDALLV